MKEKNIWKCSCVCRNLSNCFLKQVNFHSIKISWQKQRESKTRTTWRLRSAKMSSEDHHTKWVQRKDGIATGAGVRKRQWGLYSWLSGSMQKKGPELMIFPPIKTVFDGFRRKNIMWLQFPLIFFRCFSSMWAQIPPDKTLQNAASNCEEMKGATASLAKTTVFFVCWSTSLIFFLCTVCIYRFFGFWTFQLRVLFDVFLCGAALSFFGLSTLSLTWSMQQGVAPQHDMTKSRSPDIHQQRGCTGRGWNELLRSAAKGWDARTRWADVGWRAHGWNNHPVQEPSQRFP